MLGTYFYNESLRKTIIAFGSMFNDIYITRKTAAGVEAQTLKVPLAYGPKQKFMVRLDADPNLDQKVESHYLELVLKFLALIMIQRES